MQVEEEMERSFNGVVAPFVRHKRMTLKGAEKSGIESITTPRLRSGSVVRQAGTGEGGRTASPLRLARNSGPEWTREEGLAESTEAELRIDRWSL
jgi:hypothetical protein